jgi:DNA-binding NtrC family response regulator
MVIDDDGEVRQLISRMLIRLGAGRVDIAGSAPEALRAMTPSVNVLVCDVQMPNGGAADVFRGLAAGDLRPQVILMSGAGEDVLDAAAAIGQDLGMAVIARLVKPVAAAALGSALRRVVDQTSGGAQHPSPPADGGLETVVPMNQVIHFAHEAAGPLMTVTMLSELLLDDGGLTPSQAADVRQIQRAATVLSKMLKDLKGDS